MPYQKTLFYRGKEPKELRFRLLEPTRILAVNIGRDVIYCFGIKP